MRYPCSVPEEAKPIYLDFESPLYVEMFTRVLRKASALTVVEMLPSPDQVWLRDHWKSRYASELQLVAVDLEPWRPP